MATYRSVKKRTPTIFPRRNELEWFYSSDLTPSAPAVVDWRGNILRVGGLTTKDYRLVKVTTVLSGTTYTPTSGVTALYVEAIGAGGAGGGVANAATNSGAGGGGGGGGYSAAWLTSLVSGDHTVAIGAAGAAGSAGANNGGDGGDTIFKDTDATNVVLAKGGSGGVADTIATIHVGGLGGAGGVAATGAVGDTKLAGANGGTGHALAAAQAVSGAGGGGFMGIGGGLPKIAQGAGNAGLTRGAGGSGGLAISGGASVAGGAGVAGMLRIWEYA